jgi:hypothetical protein
MVSLDTCRRWTAPLERERCASILWSGQSLRLARVRFLTLPASRYGLRNKTAGGELRLGTRSMYMATQSRPTRTLTCDTSRT